MLPGKVVLLQETEQRHRHAIPPVGIAQKHRIILVEVFYIRLKLRPGAIAPLLVGALQTGIPVAGVGVCDADGKQVATGFLLHPTRQLLNISRRDHAGRRNRVYIACEDGVLCPGEIGDQNVAVCPAISGCDLRIFRETYCEGNQHRKRQHEGEKPLHTLIISILGRAQLCVGPLSGDIIECARRNV